MSGYTPDPPDELSSLPKAPPLSTGDVPLQEDGARALALTNFVLTVAEVLSVVSCIATVVSVAYLVLIAPDVLHPVLILAAGFLSFCYNAALFVVFHRVKNWK